MPWTTDGREEELHQHLLALPKDGLQGNPQAVLGAISKFTAERGRMIEFKLPKIAVSRTALQAVQPPPKILIELGTYIGNSAVAWGSILKEVNGGNSDGIHVYCLERDDVFVKIARDTIALAGLDDVVQVVPGEAADTLRKLKADGIVDTADVLFIDHFGQHYLPDLKVCEEVGLFHKGSVILADNVDNPEMDYLQYVRAGGKQGTNSVRYESKNLAAGPGRTPGRYDTVEVTTVVDVPV
ncbi:O-methyltransferase, family 3 [Niveomyces insectorum RCEF 264]|uniref:catechol O-methyltransferase n=1 Tax=Niveomyces insectorum RCEF 264 TaxID=1081102 RepID=A0A162MBR5_9HYPO|nr:O-methyltransferase, family 3 [Niveomyces insectorum RCEF 264]